MRLKALTAVFMMTAFAVQAINITNYPVRTNLLATDLILVSDVPGRTNYNLAATNLLTALARASSSTVNKTNLPIVQGISELVDGTNYVATVYASSNTPPMLTYHSLDGSTSAYGISNIVEGVGFTLYSENPADTNRIYWFIVR